MQERKVRYALAPLMQAEADREYMERELVGLRKEAEVMKGVVDEGGNGWVPGASQYFGGQWMPRRIGHFMRHHTVRLGEENKHLREGRDWGNLQQAEVQGAGRASSPPSSPWTLTHQQLGVKSTTVELPKRTFHSSSSP
eukprot:scaffold4733_cov170-Alexandrium_tamarense.AAC.22